MSIIDDDLLLVELNELESTFRKIRSNLGETALKQSDLRKSYRDFDRAYQNLFILTLADLKASQASYRDLRRDYELGLVNNENYRLQENQLRKRAEYNYSKFTGEIIQELQSIIQDLKISGLPESEKKMIEKEKNNLSIHIAEDTKPEEGKSIIDALKPYLDALLTIVSIVGGVVGLATGTK